MPHLLLYHVITHIILIYHGTEKRMVSYIVSHTLRETSYK